MTFSCTKKVRDKLIKYYPVEEDKVPVGLQNWYVDLLVIERKTYFLFTNSATLFSFFIYAGTKQELQHIGALFHDRLRVQVGRQIHTALPRIDELFPRDQPISIRKTNSRSVLGSMNELKFQIRARLAYDAKPLDAIYEAVNYSLNDMIMFAIPTRIPTREMKQTLLA